MGKCEGLSGEEVLFGLTSLLHETKDVLGSYLGYVLLHKRFKKLKVRNVSVRKDP